MSRSIDVRSTESIRARRANRLGADLIVSLRLPLVDDPGVFFFASARSRSEAGARLAGEIAPLLDLPVAGRASAILKHTRSPAVVIAHPRVSAELAKPVVAGINSFFVEAAAQE